MPLAVGWWIVGHAAHSPRGADAGRDLVRAQISATSWAYAWKYAVDRTRPNGDPRSFPSGTRPPRSRPRWSCRTTTAGRWACRSSRRRPTRRSRGLSINKHWASDVTFGAFVGIASARTVTLHLRNRNFALVPLAVPGGGGLALTRVDWKWPRARGSRPARLPYDHQAATRGARRLRGSRKAPLRDCTARPRGVTQYEKTQEVRKRILALVVSATVLCAAHVAWAQSPPAGDDTRAGRIAAQQAEKAKRLKPYEPNKAEVWVKKLEEQFITGSLHWHPFFKSAYSGGGFTLGAGYLDAREQLQHARPARELDAQRLHAARERVPGAAPVRPPRRAVGHRRLARGHAGRLLRHRHGRDVLGRSRQLQLPAAVPARPRSTSGRRGSGWCWPAAADYSQWDQRPGEGSQPSVEEVYTPDDAARARREVDLPARAGHGGHSTGARRRATRGAAATTASRSTTSWTPTTATASSRWTTRRSSTCRSCATTWVLSLRGKVETTSTRDGNQVIPFFMLPALGGGSSLRGFASWRFRDRQQPAAPGRVARARQQLPRHGALLRRRQGHGPRGRTSTWTA